MAKADQLDERGASAQAAVPRRNSAASSAPISGTTTCSAGRWAQVIALMSSRSREDLVLLDGAVGLVDAHDQRQAQRERRDADDDRGQDQHVRQRIGIDLEGGIDDRRGAADDLARRDVEQVDRGLEQRQPDQLLDQVAAGDDDVEARHHQEDGDDVIVVIGEAAAGPPSPPPLAKA